MQRFLLSAFLATFLAIPAQAGPIDNFYNIANNADLWTPTVYSSSQDVFFITAASDYVRGAIDGDPIDDWATRYECTVNSGNEKIIAFGRYSGPGITWLTVNTTRICPAAGAYNPIFVPLN